MRLSFLWVLLAAPGWPQDALTIAQAVDTALSKHPALQAGASGIRAADARVAEARGAALPRVSYAESWVRSDNPVFAFGSLLDQRQFTAANFDLNSLNNPAFLNNFQSQIVVDQTLFDNGLRKAGVQSARLGRELATQENRKTEIEVIAGVLRAYYTAIVAQEHVGVAAEAVRSAEADLKRAETRRAAGVTTDADVLSIRVHASAMREQQIRRGFELDLARAELNQAMGLPLDARYELTTPLKPVEEAAPDPTAVENEAAAARPETRAAQLSIQVGDEQRKAARAALLPEFYFRAGLEADRQRFVDRGGANWLASAGLRWNLFNGFSDRARIGEARQETERRTAQARLAESYARLDARRARLNLESATQRLAVTRASIAMAEETLRIVRNRYEGGLTEVTELLRSEAALVEARSRQWDAVRDQMLAAVELESARGKLNRNSEMVTR
jgi:outer membrane protein TolC